MAMDAIHDHDARFLRQAIHLAREHMLAGDGGPFGAVVVKDGQVLAEGWNQVTATHDPTAHAEIVAIRRAASVSGCFRLDGCVLYTSCEPCPMCLSAVFWARMTRLVYAAQRQDAARAGFDDEEFYRQLKLPVENRQLPMTQLLRDEAVAVFKTWTDLPSKIPY